MKKNRPLPSKPSQDNSIRLNKYIANSGKCSRRDADLYIRSGNVTVNGKVVNEMGYKVQPHDEVRFDGSLIKPEEKTYVLINKPKGVSTDPEVSEKKRVLPHSKGVALSSEISRSLAQIRQWIGFTDQ